MITVEMNHSESASSPTVIQSGGLGPCVGIGIYDPDNRMGHALHEVMSLETRIDSFVKNAEKNPRTMQP